MAWPTTNNPRNNFVTLRLTDDEAADVDWLQSQTSARNRSDTVRKALDRVVAAEKKRAQRAKKSKAPGPGLLDPTHEEGEDS